MLPPSATSLFETPQRTHQVTTFDTFGSVPLLNGKVESDNHYKTEKHGDKMTTRQASLVATYDEMEQEWDRQLRPEATKRFQECM
ncbi:unnamed protein product [Peronospora destructor]|uniref:Uncharacterized protein n=1 Tax=Peronospora destructor TaxID=86335 RepID=A0AAV0TUX3_9STRA|nr:unnamed protein product [Peronospora destructor]